MYKYYLIYPFLILLLFSCVNDPEIPEPKGVIFSTTLYSNHVNVLYNLHISLPPNYFEENKQYRVIYILDGEDLIESVLASLEELQSRNQLKKISFWLALTTGRIPAD